MMYFGLPLPLYWRLPQEDEGRTVAVRLLALASDVITSAPTAHVKSTPSRTRFFIRNLPVRRIRWPRFVCLGEYLPASLAYSRERWPAQGPTRTRPRSIRFRSCTTFS